MQHTREEIQEVASASPRPTGIPLRIGDPEAIACEITNEHQSKAIYRPGLDGIRAVAIVAVLLSHAGISWLSGGFLGVDVFFVLSGYLITGLLTREYLLVGRIDLPAFYARRTRRLLPALGFMLLTSTVCAALFMKDALAAAIRDLPWAITGTVNWWFILRHLSYFEIMGRPPLFQHTWSLAVEAQFYLVWPLLVLLLLPILGVSGLRKVAIILGAISAGTLVAIGSGANVMSSAAGSHAYFGTDTHSVGLFLGAALAATRFPMSAQAVPQSARWPRALLQFCGVLGFGLLLVLFHVVEESPKGFYRLGVPQGIPLASILSMILIAVAGQPGGIVGRWLEFGPLRWIGQRSYGMYLWHWPIFQATRPQIDVAVSDGFDLLLRIVLTVAAAELSYRYIEMPFRRRVRGDMATKQDWRSVSALAIAIVVVVIAGSSWFLGNIINANTNPQNIIVAVSPQRKAVFQASSRVSSTATIAQGTSAKPARPQLGTGDVLPADAAAAQKVPAVLVGDSVLLAASLWIGQQINIVKVDAVVGRQALQLRALIERMAAAGELQSTMILNLGNNGTVDEATLRGILGKLKECRRVVVVNARVPRSWQEDDDALMARIVPIYRNAALADWRRASDNHPEYFGPDGIHPGAVGARAYSDLIVKALRSIELPESDEAGDANRSARPTRQ
jgi:peptidoglycan/LPS O-acetylase OafA/YrhL